MTTNAIMKTRIANYLDIERQINALKAQLETEKEALLKGLETRELDELRVCGYKVSYKAVESNRIDTKMLKTEFPGAAKACMKVSVSCRFLVGLDKGK